MNPVELLRLIQFSQIIARGIEKGSDEMSLTSFPLELSRITGMFHLGSMTLSRVRSVLKEISVCGLCHLGKTGITLNRANLDTWDHFSECINYDLQDKCKRWKKLDGFLAEKHDLYEAFVETADKVLGDKTSLREVLRQSFSQPTISVLVEWGLKLNRVQQSYIDENIVYPIRKDFKLNQQNVDAFKESLKSFYLREKNDLQIETVSLPHIAEKVCASLKITRDDFRDFLENLHAENPSRIWLGTGNIRTYAYEDFISKKQSLLNVAGEGPWFLRNFDYKNIDLPEYSINGIPRRFIKIIEGGY